ncbi:MAG TPA: signal recognition particle protein [Gemmatimonadales bacterium]|nr:signal recognition particle protein [Gemmatimonadales bacterium]
MFEELSEKLSAALRDLRGRGVLTEGAIREGLETVRRALLEADVGFEVAREFTERVAVKAVGIPALRTVAPGQQLVKVVHEELVALLGGSAATIRHASIPPTIVFLVGLQGSGKTTTAAKLARRLTLEQKAPFLVAADVYRPAAIDQLVELAGRVKVGIHAEPGESDVVSVVRRGVEAAKKARARTVLVDTAGRLAIDAEMMDELRRLKAAVPPHEVLLVADGMTGQDAVRIARGFHEAVELTGVVLTKMDGDSRGGAALSIYWTTKAPIKYVGVGEGLDAIEPFRPDRMAGRMLQMGDVLSLVEKAEQALDRDKAEKLARKAVSKKGMDLEDFLTAMREMQKLGPLESLVGMLPGMGRQVMDAVKQSDPKRLKHVEAIVLSMTPAERKNPDIINGSRRARIAKGSGRPVQEVNRLLKQFEEMGRLMKGKKGRGGMPGIPMLPRGAM